MLKKLDFRDKKLVQRALAIQQLAYRIEADLIGFDGIPALHETVQDLRASSEVFIGYFEDDILAAVLSYEIEGTELEIGRLVVHPDYFRRGIAKTLIKHVEAIAGIRRWIVSTGSDNLPARKLYDSLAYQVYDEVTLDVGIKITCYHKQLFV